MVKFNFWRQLRLAGAVVVLAAAFLHLGMNLILLGLIMTAVGTVNGVLSLERRVDELEAKDAKNNP